MSSHQQPKTARINYREALILEGILSRLTTLKGMAIQMRDTAANDDWRMYRDGQAEAFGEAASIVRRAMAEEPT